MPLVLCRKQMKSRSKYAPEGGHRCHLPQGHDGKCKEYPYLDHLSREAPKVAKKIERDAIMTTGASWKSKDAGPNRIRRWVMLLDDDALRRIGLEREL